MIGAALGLAALLASAGVQEAPAVRLHHLHYRVGDPSAAMAAVVERLQGTRVIVQGLGVGVRVGDEYLLFDRAEGPAAPASYAAAVEWLKAHGVTVAPSSLPAQASAAVPGERIDHFGFVTADFDALVARLEGGGATVVRANEDAVRFAAGAGVVEVVRDTERPDAYWCPMHPDVRSADAGKCSLCGMDLVPIPPPKVGEYRLDVVLEPAAKRQGLRRMRFTVREPDTNAPVGRFATVHEKPFHLFVISRDLEYFEHVHPVPSPDGSFVLEQRIPPGEYMLIADFLPEGGTPQMVQKAIVSPGLTPGRARSRAPGPSSIRVALEAGGARAGKELPMVFTVTDATTGAPVTDLQPYLGAPAHMLVVREDLTDAIHAHPEEQATVGPTVSFHPLIPAPGDYKLWIQFRRQGQVITVPFRFTAQEP